MSLELIPKVTENDWNLRNAIRICELQYAEVSRLERQANESNYRCVLWERALAQLREDRKNVSKELAKLLQARNPGGPEKSAPTLSSGCIPAYYDEQINSERL